VHSHLFVIELWSSTMWCTQYSRTWRSGSPLLCRLLVGM